MDDMDVPPPVLPLQQTPSPHFHMHSRSPLVDVVADVHSVGHCLFGCQSCAHEEQSLLTYFSRYVRGTLPYDAAAARAMFSAKGMPEGAATSTGMPFDVAIVGPLPV